MAPKGHIVELLVLTVGAAFRLLRALRNVGEITEDSGSTGG